MSKLRALQLFAYGGPAFVLNMLWVPVTVYLPQLYAKHTAMGFALIGTVIVVSKVFDAVADQIIGLLSDNTHSRLGRRKPWLIAGAVILLPAVFFLFAPPADAGAAYLSCALIAFYLGWSMIFIPYNAMAPELATEYDERTRLAGAYGIGYGLGQLGFNLMPIVLGFLGIVQTSEYSLNVLQVLSLFCVIALPTILALVVFCVPNGGTAASNRPTILGVARDLVRNRPFLVYATAFVLFTAANGVQAAVAFTFYDSYLKIGSSLPYLVVFVVIASTGSVPLWTAISRRIGKHRALALGWAFATLTLQGYWFLPPGPNAVVMLGVLLTCLGFSHGIYPVAANAILADVVDYGTWRTGDTRAGSYYAMQAFLMKVAQAAGAGGGFLMLGAFGFQAKEQALNGPTAVRGILITLIAVPTLLNLGALSCILLFPLNRRRLEIVRKRIDSRKTVAAG